MILYYVIYMRTTCSSSLGEEETGWSGGWSVQLGQAGHLPPAFFFFSSSGLGLWVIEWRQ